MLPINALQFSSMKVEGVIDIAYSKINSIGFYFLMLQKLLSLQIHRALPPTFFDRSKNLLSLPHSFKI